MSKRNRQHSQPRPQTTSPSAPKRSAAPPVAVASPATQRAVEAPPAPQHQVQPPLRAIATSARPTTAHRQDRLGALALVLGGIVLVALAALFAERLAPAGGIDSSNLLVIFLTGLTTGGLTCLAVQGGLLATTVAQREHAALSGADTLAGRAAPIAMFLGAKLVAYTILGALLGMVGSAIGLTPTLQGWLQVVMGLFMLGVAGQILDLHPIFRYFSFQPPRWIQRRIRQESKSGSLLSPALLGTLTVFIPCATTQVMMIAAIGTGSPLAGALTMFAFTLGTIPLFFSLGYLATQLSAALRGMFMRLAAAAIVLLALFSMTGGLALLGVPIPDIALFSTSATASAQSPSGVAPAAAVSRSVAPQAPASGVAPSSLPLPPGAANPPSSALSSAAAPSAPQAGAASAVTITSDGVQEAILRAEPTAYLPNRIQFKVGTPARIRLVTGERRGCTSAFLIPALGVQKIMDKNSQAVFDIPTDKPQKIGFTCSMGMYRGVIEVVA